MITDDDGLGLYSKLDQIDKKEYACVNHYKHDVTAMGRYDSKYYIPNQLGKVIANKNLEEKCKAFIGIENQNPVEVCKIPMDQGFEVIS